MSIEPADMERITESRAYRYEPSGVLSLGGMSEGEFASKLVLLENSIKRLKMVKESVLSPGEDFDAVPGTKKMTLLKPGAEKLCMMSRMAPDFVVQRIAGDGTRLSPAITYVITCRLHTGDTAGPVVAEGVGSCNSNERKYRYRKGDMICPACSKAGSIIKGRAEYGGGWVCFSKKGGCGAKFADDDSAIVGQQVGEVENQDPFDLDNTLLKMGKKRALVDAVLTATASSGMFTQDMEETVTHEQREAERKRLTEQFINMMDTAKVPSKERGKVASRLMRETVRSLSSLSLAKLRVLVDRVEEDDEILGMISDGVFSEETDKQ